MKLFGNGVCLAVALTVAGCGQPSRQTSPLPSGGPVSEVSTAPKDTGPRFEPLPDGPDAEKEFTTTKSGLKYKILRKGTGKFPTVNDRFVAHYKGWLDDGKVFDQSYDDGKPLGPHPMTKVVTGWTEGLQLISEGGKIELELPPDLAYANDPPTPDIPPNSTLHFLVELVEVVP